MKNIKTALLIAFIFNCNLALSQLNDPIATSLKHFYTYYILENDRIPPGGGKFSRDTLEKYFTASFLKKTGSDSELDYDPIIYFQDFDKEWVNTLKITKLKGSNAKIKNYDVCFWYAFGHVNHCITVFMIKENGIWKINKTCNKGNCN